MAAFRAALVVDVRHHRLAWSVIAAGLMACAMLWGSLLGVPLARPARYEATVPAADAGIEHPVEMEPAE